MTKKIIVTADDFGINKEANEAISMASDFKILTNTCIMANCEGFEEAVQIAKDKQDFVSVGVHLNIIEGKSLINNSISPVTDKNGFYNLSFVQMLLKSYDKKFLKEVEKEFRSQVEKVIQSGIKPDWLNSHVHTHAIPQIFEIVCKLANEYNIQNIRTQNEIPYTTFEFKRHFSISYFMNIIKNLLLNFLNIKNKRLVKKYGLNTTDYFIGVLYTGNMDIKTFKSGIKALPKNCSCEIILHPTTNKDRKKNFVEFQTLLSPELKEFIEKSTHE